MSKGLISTANELVTFHNSQSEEVRGTILKLSHSVIVFEVYNPYSIVQLSEVLSGLKIVRLNQEIYNGKATVTNIVNTGIILIVAATLSDDYWKSTFDISSKKDIQKEIGRLISTFDTTQGINSELKTNILSIRSFLSDLHNWFEKFESSFERDSSLKINDKFILDYFSPLFERLTAFFRRSSELLKEVKEPEINMYKKFIQSNLHHLVMSSPFPVRALSKPLGFAGDYMMMHMIQRDSAEGSSLYAKFVNVFYANIPLSISVNNRTSRLLKIIEEGVKKAEDEGREYNSLSVGCGPALEIRYFLERNNPKVKCNFYLLDFNQETLDFAKSEADKVNKSDLCSVFTRLNSVHELLKKSVNKKFEDTKYDFIYCSGLFDYLSDKVCAKLTKMFYEMLRVEGRVFVTNMHINDIDRYIVEILLEWYLIYRDEDTMKTIAPSCGESHIYTDSTGVNLCLEVTKS